MTVIALNLKVSKYSYATRDAVAQYDFETGDVSGPDANDVQQVISLAQSVGYAQPIPCCSIKIPPAGEPLSPSELAAVLCMFWDLSDTSLPAVAVSSKKSSDPSIVLIN